MKKAIIIIIILALFALSFYGYKYYLITKIWQNRKGNKNSITESQFNSYIPRLLFKTSISELNDLLTGKIN